MICSNCGKKGARVRKITRLVGSGRSACLVEGVPLVRCPNCGESYFTAKTIKELERIQAQRRKLGVVKKIRVAKFGGAA